MGDHIFISCLDDAESYTGTADINCVVSGWDDTETLELSEENFFHAKTWTQVAIFK